MVVLRLLNRFWERPKITFPFGCEELARSLVGEKGYEITCGSDSGCCNWRKKTVHLSYDKKRNDLAAVFEAAHEAGHAVYGPTPISRLLFVFWGIYFVWLLVCLWGGFNGILWLPILSPMASLFAIRSIDYSFDELRATRYARKKLDRMAPGQKEKSALDIHFAAYCLAHTVFPVSLGAALLACGRLVWRFGAYFGGG